MEDNDAYAEGREAFHRGDDDAHNPYSGDDVSWDLWNEGFYDAAAENDAYVYEDEESEDE